MRLIEKIQILLFGPQIRIAPPKGTQCPVHGRVHDAHGWYYCLPDGSGFWNESHGVVYWVSKKDAANGLP